MIQRKNVLLYVSGVLDLKYRNEFGKAGRIEVDLSKSLFPDFSRNAVLLGINANIVV